MRCLITLLLSVLLIACGDSSDVAVSLAPVDTLQPPQPEPIELRQESVLLPSAAQPAGTRCAIGFWGSARTGRQRFRTA